MIFLALAGPLPPLIDEDGGVIFRYKGEAQEVYLAGSFNDWDTKADPMEKKEDNLWVLKKYLTPGKYEYKFVIDGEWLPGPNIPLVLAYDESGRIVIKRERPSNTLANWWAVLTGRLWSDVSAGMSNGTARFGGSFYSFVDFGFDFKKGISAGFRIGATPSSVFVDEAQVSFEKEPFKYLLFYNVRGIFDFRNLVSHPSYGVLTDIYRPLRGVASWSFMKYAPWGAGEGLYGLLASSKNYIFAIYSSGGGTPGGIFGADYRFKLSSFGSVSVDFSPRVLATASPSEDVGIETTGGWAEYPEGNPYGVWYHFDEIRVMPEATLTVLPAIGLTGHFELYVSPLYEETWGPSLYLHADMSNGKEPGGPGYDHPVDVTFEESERYHRRHFGAVMDFVRKTNLFRLFLQGYAAFGEWMMDNVTYSSSLFGAGLWTDFGSYVKNLYMGFEFISLKDYEVPSALVLHFKIPPVKFWKISAKAFSRSIFNGGEEGGFDSLTDFQISTKLAVINFGLGLKFWKSSYGSGEGSQEAFWLSPYAFALYRAGTFAMTLYSGMMDTDPWGIPRWYFSNYENEYQGNLWDWYFDPEGRVSMCNDMTFTLSVGVRVDAQF